MEQCYFCKGKVTERTIRHVHQWGEKVFIFNSDQGFPVAPKRGSASVTSDRAPWMRTATPTIEIIAPPEI